VLARGLAKKREQRIRSVRELGELVAGFLLEHGVDSDITGVPLASFWRSAAAGGIAARNAADAGDSAARDSMESSGTAVVLTRIEGRRRKAPARGRPLAAAVVVGAAALLVPTSFLVSVARSKSIAETARSSVDVTVDVARAASATVEQALSLVPREVESPPPVEPLVQGSEPPRPRTDLALAQPTKQRAERMKPEAPKPREQRTTTDEQALRVLGLKAPYP